MANPNPDRSGLRPFEPGQSGNPGGKTSAQRKLEVENAEKATRLQAFLLDREIGAITEPADVAASEHVRQALADVLSPTQLQTVLSTLTVALTNERLKLIKDAQDRGLGTPKQTAEIDGNVSYNFNTIYEPKPDGR